MSLQTQAVEILTGVLQLSEPAAKKMGANTPLLGAIPEFDSMAVISVITALEDRFGIVIEDDEIDASVFETLGSLVAFLERKLA